MNSSLKVSNFQVGDIIKHAYKNVLCIIVAVYEYDIIYKQLNDFDKIFSFALNSMADTQSKIIIRNPDLTPENIRIIHPELFL